MLDQAKSSPNPRRLPTEGTLAPSPTHTEADPTPLPAALSRSTKTDEHLYSIRIADNPGTRCAACGNQETGPKYRCLAHLNYRVRLRCSWQTWSHRVAIAATLDRPYA